MKHTSTPWALRPDGKRIEVGDMRHPAIIAKCVGDNAIPNAARIVLCCNSHDELVTLMTNFVGHSSCNTTRELARTLLNKLKE
jgi:hypothetical protein